MLILISKILVQVLQQKSPNSQLDDRTRFPLTKRAGGTVACKRGRKVAYLDSHGGF